MGTHRPRMFLGGLVVATAAAVALSADSAAALTERVYTGGPPACRIDGGAAELLARATVIDTTTASGTTSEATLQVPPQTSRALLAWFGQIFAGTATAPKRVELLQTNHALAITEVETFPRASIAWIQFPELDASSMSFLEWTVKLAPTATTRTAGAGSVTPPAALTKKLVAGHFRFSLQGIDTSRVTKIQSIVVTPRRAAPTTPTIIRTPTPFRTTDPALATPPAISNLVFWMDTARAQAVTQWLTSGAEPRSGSIAHLRADLVTTQCTTTLSKIVVKTVTTETVTGPGGSQQSRVEATVGDIRLTCAE